MEIYVSNVGLIRSVSLSQLEFKYSIIAHMKILREWIKSSKLIVELAKNDFGMRFAGSFFGVLWAFVQPIVIVLLYVFVFQVAFHAGPADGGYPYVLWLIAGLCPWLFFTEAVTSATGCFVEYNYLVKKVVFPISILPLVKTISASFVHVFFVVFSFLIYLLMGKVPGISFVQIIYYCICLLLLVIGLSFLTSSIVPFFKDLQSIVPIIMNIGMWMTPILWNIDAIGNQYLRMALSLNPMFYIVNGYRESFMNGHWIWEHPGLTLAFWVELLLIYALGISTFYKSKPHFADVL